MLIKIKKFLHGKYFLPIFLIFVFTLVFKTNCIDSWNRNYSGFQYDSEDLAIGSLAATHYQLAKPWQGLGRLKFKKPEKGYNAKDRWISERIYKDNIKDKETSP